jgi:hypothetical protein
VSAFHKEAIEGTPHNVDAFVSIRRTGKLDLLKMLPHVVPLFVPRPIRAEDGRDVGDGISRYNGVAERYVGGLAPAAATGAGLIQVL